MNQKQSKLLRKGAGESKLVHRTLKKAFKKLSPEEKEEFLRQVRPARHLL